MVIVGKLLECQSDLAEVVDALDSFCLAQAAPECGKGYRAKKANNGDHREQLY